MKISKELKAKLLNRLKSFIWRASSMILVMALEEIVTTLGDFSINPVIVMGIGLFSGEVTKYLNTEVIHKK
jgi:hypothetical protein